MQETSGQRWVVILVTLVGLWLWSGSAAHAASVGAWAAVSVWITGLTGLAWLICVCVLVFGVVKFLLGLTTYREEGLGHGMIQGAMVIIAAVIAFFIVPPLVEAGLALGATLR